MRGTTVLKAMSAILWAVLFASMSFNPSHMSYNAALIVVLR